MRKQRQSDVATTKDTQSIFSLTF